MERIAAVWKVDFVRGLKAVPDQEVLDLYGGTNHVPLQQASGFYGKVQYM